MKKRSLVKDNARQAARILLNRLKVKFNSFSLDWFFYHPEFPSMFAFSQLFDRLKLKHAVIKATPNDLEYLPKPFLTHFISDGGGFFIVVDAVNEEKVQFVNEKGLIEDYAKKDFIAGWSGVAAIFDPDGQEKENDFFKTRMKEFLAKHRGVFFYLSIVAMVIFMVLYYGVGRYSGLNIIFIITKLIGLFLSSVLLIETFDDQNPFFHKVCSSDNKGVSCSGILSSSGARLFGVLSWSEIGFNYFLILFLYLIIFPGIETLNVVSLISFLAAPYTIYSIWYQKYVAHLWCKLCLFIQVILFIDLLSSLLFYNYWEHQHLYLSAIMPLLTLGLLSISSYSLLKPVFEVWIKDKTEMPKLRKLKFDTDVFTIMQNRIHPVTIPIEELDPIKFGAENGKYQITMISNPLCRPCQKAHESIFRFLKYKKDTTINEIFLMDIKPDEQAYQTAICMLALEKTLPSERFLYELIDFYHNHAYSPTLWRSHYTNLDLEDTKIIDRLNKQIEWCNEQKINSTPLIIYNGRILSNFYQLDDLDYFTE